MNVQQLKELFNQRRQHDPEELNELLDFAKNIYILNEISLKEYSILIQSLERNGALIPSDYYPSSFRYNKMHSLS
ncbi:YppF family protein [Bacillus sp. 2205SS5-2]|uniref:YppF family protein n=1 Tax=Bacillus sp. 2205SS5-2 TaxID=3109031 RepID=UPI0030058678